MGEVPDRKTKFNMDVTNTRDAAKNIKNMELKDCKPISGVPILINTEVVSTKISSEKSNDWKKSLKLKDEMELDEDTICGIGSFRPQWLQAWATPRCYLVLLTIVSIIQGSYYSYFLGMISTLEKRFAFKSKISGLILMVDEITPLFFGVLVGYFCGKSHRPRLLAVGMFITAFCCFLTALPYFIYGTAQHLVSPGSVKNESGPQMCDFQSEEEHCNEDDRPPTMSAICILFAGCFLKGFGGLAFHAVGLTYMDDNAKKKNTPIYIAVSMSLRLIGPTIGFLMSSFFLKYYENPFVDPGFTIEDPRWVGAWWMGFVLQGIFLFIFSTPFLLFPRRLPSAAKPAVTDSRKETLRECFLGLWIGLKRLWKNSLYVCIIVLTTFNTLGGFGYFIMLPKYMESQFRLNSSDASLYSGPPGLISLQISILFGGILIWKFKPSPRRLIIGIMISEGISCLGCLALMIPSCNQLEIAGSTEQSYGLELVNDCNMDCMCTTSVYTPLCGPDGHSTYFSPCYAGCSASGVEGFQNCSCIQTPTGGFEYARNITKGYCPDDDCWFQALIYICMVPVLNSVAHVLLTAYTMILFRCVDNTDKSFAVGTSETLLCGLAFMPHPVIFGALVDSACLVWESSCGKTGNCWLYDNDKFKYILHGMSSFFAFAGVLCAYWMLTLSSKLKNLYDDEDVIEDITNKNQNGTKTEARTV